MKLENKGKNLHLQTRERERNQERENIRGVNEPEVEAELEVDLQASIRETLHLERQQRDTNLGRMIPTVKKRVIENTAGVRGVDIVAVSVDADGREGDERAQAVAQVVVLPLFLTAVNQNHDGFHYFILPSNKQNCLSFKFGN